MPSGQRRQTLKLYAQGVSSDLSLSNVLINFSIGSSVSHNLAGQGCVGLQLHLDSHNYYLVSVLYCETEQLPLQLNRNLGSFFHSTSKPKSTGSS